MSNHPSENTKGRLLRRALAGILTLALMLGLLPASVFTAHAASWADSYVQTLVDWGVMRGDIGGNMAPDRSITRAEFVTMMNRAYGYKKLGGHPFTDVRVRDWYNEDIDIAYNIGYFKGTSDTTASPNDSLTREQAAVLLARNMMLQETVGETLGFSDTRRLSDWSRGLVGAAAANGIISGYEDGSFQPMRNITRGEVAAMLVRAIGTPIQEAGDHALGNVYGNVTVNASGVKLRDGVIAGNLYLTGGIGLGEVLLENVTVLGEIIVSGGGESNSSESSIVLRNVVADKMLVDSISSQFVTIRAEGNTDIPTTTVRTNAYVDDSSLPGYGLSYIELDGENGALYQLAGNIKEVINKTPGSSLQVVQGIADKVTVDEEATGSNVLVDGDAQVGDLNLDTGTNVTGSGDIKNLNVGSAGSTVEQLPDKIVIRPGIEADVGGSNMNSSQGAEASADPKLLAGYPAVRKIAPNSAELVFRVNKPGTIYWAVSAVADGSVSEADLLEPPVYGNKVLASGKITATAANTDYTAAVNRLTSAGSYYVTAMLVDGRDQRSPIKVTSFSTPDDTVPAFTTGYPYMSKTTCETAQATVMTTKSCLLYYALLPSGAAAPTPAELKAAAVTGNLGYGSQSVTKSVATPINVNRVPLEEKTTYDLYLWLTDHDGAKSMARPQRLTFTTPDETPPKVTNMQQTFPTTPANQADRIVNMAYTMDEPGSLIWAIVTDSEFNADNKTFLQWTEAVPNAGDDTRGTLKFKKEGTDDIDEAKTLAAKIKLESGMGAIQGGSAPRSPFNITNLLTQNTHTSIYYVYYMGKDTAGNYSDEIKYIRVNTEDRTPPEFISQTYTPVPDEEHRPLASSSVSLTFSENIQGGTDGKAMFLNLYAEVERTRKAYRNSPDATSKSAYDTARNELGAALREHFVMYRQPVTGQPEAVTVRDEKNDGSNNTTAVTNWTVDWRNAQVKMADGRFVLTLPTISDSDKEHTEEKRDSALKLESGMTYYIKVDELYDLAVSPNPLNYQNQQIWAQGSEPRRNLPKFTTIDVQVWLNNGDEPAIINAKNGTVDYTPVDGLDEKGTVVNSGKRIDYHFQVRPQDVDRVEDNLYWDMLIWFNDNVNFTLYSRPINESGKPIDAVTGEVLPDAATAPWYLETPTESTAGNPTVTVGKDSFKSYINLYRTPANAIVPDYKQIKTMLDPVNTDKTKTLPKRELREYAIHLNVLNDENDYTAWTNPNVTLRVSVVAGTRNQLGDIKSGGNETAYNNALNQGVRPIETPTPYTMSKGFNDQRLPSIQTGTPNLVSRADDSARITLRLTRPGKVHYMVMPLSQLVDPDNPNAYLDNEELVEGDLLKVTTFTPPIPLKDESGKDFAGLKDIPLIFGDSKAVTTGSDKSKVGDHVKISKPGFTSFTESSGDYERLGIIRGVTDTANISQQLLTIDLSKQLKANTAYVLCLLPSGIHTVPDDKSEILCYRFTTNMMELPKLELAGINNPTIDAKVEDGTSALMSYFVVRYGSEGSDFQKDFYSDTEANSIAKAEYKTVKDRYPKVKTVLDAMTTYVRSGTDNKFQGTVFDLYAKDERKFTYRQLIVDSSNPDSSNPTIIGGSGLAEVELDNTAQLKLGDLPRMQAGTDYTIIAMARKDATSNNYAFCAWHKVHKQSQLPPMVNSAAVSGVTQKLQDPSDPDSPSIGIASARVTLQFTDSLYYWDTKDNKGYPIDNCKKDAEKHSTNPVGSGNNKCYSLGFASSSTSKYITVLCADKHTNRNAIKNIVLDITDLPGNQGDSILFDNYKIVGSTGNGTDPNRHSLLITVRAVNKGTAEAPSYDLEVTIDKDWDAT